MRQPLGHCLLIVDISGCFRQIQLAVPDKQSWLLQPAVSKCEVLVIISGRGTGHDKPGIKITPYQRSDNICTQD